MSTLAALWLLAASPSATLVIYRDTAEPLLFRPTLLINGQEIGGLGEKRFLAFELPPGKYRIEARWPKLSGHKSATAVVMARGGAETYVELTGRAAFWRTPALTMLVERPPADGAARAAACCKPAN